MEDMSAVPSQASTGVRGTHTPGPWKVIETPESSNQDFIVRAGKSSIASLFFQPRRSEQEANARLIAAAPALAEALRDLLDLGDKHAVKKARAALCSLTLVE